ncbi:sensor histidine kinase [Hufsiella ginkgonis]|uniref:Histidine kinase domain-containing protein n=1 Tax=Hufsiella ginkgonis TaxID=2695274 RepID=A0A7K1XV13_9SPHI|nr:ATP-binding protein [Hufsiella ginkgonis]MXV14810.1 hypothetical protein [Hufsiella ginkgonis]
MQETFSQDPYLTVIISTLLLLFFVCLLTYFFFRQQKKRFQHEQEVIELRESFNQTILQSKLEIQDRTLQHIAEELHANFSHLVSLININLSAILPQSSGDVKEHISETKALAKQLMTEVKALSVSLNSDFIMKTGFVKALENELDRLAKTRQYEVSLTKSGSLVKLPPGQEVVLFRLCQEILNNVVKHAEATKVEVTLNYADHSLTAQVKDNGKGFDVKEASAKSAEKESTGLLNMANRARLIQADFELMSNPGSGTVVTVVLPLNQ